MSTPNVMIENNNKAEYNVYDSNSNVINIYGVNCLTPYEKISIYNNYSYNFSVFSIGYSFQ